MCDELQVGDLVLESDPLAAPLRARARGPFTVLQVKNNGVVRLSTVKTGYRARQSFD